MNGSALSGILVVDKEAEMTSHDVISRVRKSLSMKKVGHAGTLDPFATGVLVVMVGEGTKLSDHLMSSEKVYRATMRLGTKTDTGDLTGKAVDEKVCPPLTEEAIRSVLKSFTGVVSQVPPMYSALKKDGVPLYRLARKGVEIERESREVFIRELNLLELSGQDVTFEVTCSKGTYVRTLAEDIAEALNTCGHLVELRRMRSGPFGIDKALSLDDLASYEKTVSALLPLSESLPNMSEIVVDEEAVEKIGNGIQLKAGWVRGFNPAGDINRSGPVKVMSQKGLLLSIVDASLSSREWDDLPSDSIIGKSLRVFNAR